MKKLILLCSLLSNLYPLSTEMHASKLLEHNNAYAFSCKINLVDCKQACPDLKSLADTLFPMLLDCEYFDNVVHGKVDDGFEACLFNDNAAVLIKVNGTDIYIKLTNDELFNTYLVSAQLAYFFEATYFDSSLILS
jgi:hypothetical protein